MNSKMKSFLGAFCLFLMYGGFVGTALAQEYSFSGDAAVVSKYIWRGQRLTNDWSFQPSMTLGISGFSMNAWGNMDMTKVNPGEADGTTLDIPEVTPGERGLQGKFSEIDYTFAYDHSFESASVGGGVIFYTFPDRGSLPDTEEIYVTVSADSVPGAPSITAYFDVDETHDNDGSMGLYVSLGAGHSIEFPSPVFTGLDLTAAIGFVNNGFTEYYYPGNPSTTGAHDFNLTTSWPITISDRWSASAFATYSALLGDFRQYQYPDPRSVALGTAGTPGSYADTVWGGFSVSLGF